MSIDTTDKNDTAFLDALSEERKVTRSYTAGEITSQERYSKIVKAWSGILVHTLTALILFASGTAGISTFLLVMLMPVL